MHTRRIGRTVAAMLIATGVAVATPSSTSALPQKGGPPPEVRFSTFNASLNRNAAGQLVADLSTPTNAQAATVAEIIQRVRPDVLLINEFDFVDGRARGPAVPGQLPVGAPQRRRRHRLPVPVRGAVEHRHPVGIRPQQQRRHRRARRRLRLRVLPRPVRHGRVLDVPDRRSTRCARSRTSSGRTCPAPCCPTTRRRRPRRLVLARGARRLPPLVEEPLGRADRHRRRASCTSSSATRRRRCSTAPRTATAAATSTRSASGPTTSRPAAPALHLRRRRPHRRAAARQPFVIAGDQNSDPLDGDSIPGAVQQLLEHPLIKTAVTPTSDGAVEAASCQGGINVTHLSDPQFDTADFCRHRPGQPARRLRAAVEEPAHHRRRRVLADGRRPAVPARRRLPVPQLRPPHGLDRRRRARRSEAVARQGVRPTLPHARPAHRRSGDGGGAGAVRCRPTTGLRSPRVPTRMPSGGSSSGLTGAAVREGRSTTTTPAASRRRAPHLSRRSTRRSSLG